MQENPIAVAKEMTDDLYYKAGDTINLTAKDYMYGIIVGTVFYVNLPLDKPVKASSASLSISDNSFGVGTVQGLKTVTSFTVTSSTIAKTSVQFVISTNVSAVDVSPIAFGITGTLTFS